MSSDLSNFGPLPNVDQIARVIAHAKAITQTFIDAAGSHNATHPDAKPAEAVTAASIKPITSAGADVKKGVDGNDSQNGTGSRGLVV